MKLLKTAFSRPESPDIPEDLALDADARRGRLPTEDMDGTLFLKALSRATSVLILTGLFKVHICIIFIVRVEHNIHNKGGQRGAMRQPSEQPRAHRLHGTMLAALFSCRGRGRP